MQFAEAPKSLALGSVCWLSWPSPVMLSPLFPFLSLVSVSVFKRIISVRWLWFYLLFPRTQNMEKVRTHGPFSHQRPSRHAQNRSRRVFLGMSGFSVFTVFLTNRVNIAEEGNFNRLPEPGLFCGQPSHCTNNLLLSRDIHGSSFFSCPCECTQWQQWRLRWQRRQQRQRGQWQQWRLP